MNSESIKNFLEAFSESISKEEVELYKSLLDKGVGGDNVRNPEDFYYKVLHPFKEFVSGLISHEFSNDSDVKFILLNSSFIERNFKEIIEKIEGMACCADKSRTILKRLFDFYNSDKTKEIEFNYEAEYTYHLPKKVFTTHEDIINFYQALKSLYYGRGEDYLGEMLKISNIIRDNSK